MAVGRFCDQTKRQAVVNDYRQENGGQAPEKRHRRAKTDEKQRDALRACVALNTRAYISHLVGLIIAMMVFFFFHFPHKGMRPDRVDTNGQTDAKQREDNECEESTLNC